ncbi:MAG: RNA pseudouridine synthase [Candidatus Liptonbacteria bacterium]|nr:RNA pseudouridine synthase [Candidatus Liptonbacteria bacterium]
MVLNNTRINADETRIRADKAVIMEEPKIIYEDENFAAVYKPAGMLTHPARTNADRTQTDADNFQRSSAPSPRESAILTDWLLKKYPEMKNVGDEPEIRPGIVHRLDRETSGILLAAKNQNSFEYLKSLFKKRQIKKTYIALVHGEFKEKTGVIDKEIRRKKNSVKRTTFSGKTAKQAITRYAVKKTLKDTDGEIFSLLEVFPETGRTHQIRVHLASIGHPVVGDMLYGSKNQPAFTNASAGRPAFAKRLMLHAGSLEFSTEEGRRFKLEVEPPDDFV